VTPGTTDALAAWTAIGSANITVIADSSPLSAALPNALQVTVPSGSSGDIGFGNSGYFGINVNDSWTYNASFFFRFPSDLPPSPVTATVSLSSATDGTVFASATTDLTPTSNWTQSFISFKPNSSSSDINNNFTVTFDGSEFSGTINFGLFSLFPPTFKGQQNGMRQDIAQTLFDMKPSFFRFPGGNNIEVSIRLSWIT
jgi:alpha-L-arabinofuranosidase